MTVQWLNKMTGHIRLINISPDNEMVKRRNLARHVPMLAINCALTGSYDAKKTFFNSSNHIFVERKPHSFKIERKPYSLTVYRNKTI